MKTFETFLGIAIIAGLFAFVSGFHPVASLIVALVLVATGAVVALCRGGYHDTDEADEQRADSDGFAQRRDQPENRRHRTRFFTNHPDQD